MTGNTRSDRRGGGPARLSDRGFGFLFTVIFGAVGAVMWIAGGEFPAWAAGLAGLFAALALGAPGILMPLNRMWQAFLVWFARVNNVVLAALAFFVTIVPTALVLKLIGRDPLARRIRREADSYWTPVGRQTTAETLDDPF